MADLRFSKVKLTLDGKQVELSLDTIRKKAAQTAEAMRTMQPNSKEWKAAKQNLDALHAAEEDLIPTLQRVEHYMKEMGSTATTDLGKATRELTKLRDAMPGDHKDLSKVNGFIELFKDWMKQNRELGMTFTKAEEQLKSLVNVSPEKLRQGLAAVNKEMEKATKPEDVAKLKGYQRQYEAEIAVRDYGRAGNASLQAMNADQLRAEQSRLRSAYLATDGAQGYETISKEYLDRLQLANQRMQELTESERKRAQQAREDQAAKDKEREAWTTLTKVIGDQAVSLKDLETALKFYEDRLKEVKGVDDFFTKDTLENIRLIKEARDRLNNIDVHGMAQSPNDHSLNELREASRVAKDRFADMKPTDHGYQQMKEDIIALDAAISAYTPKVEKLAGVEQQAAQAADIIARANRNEKVTFDELREAEKALTEQIKGMEGINLPWNDQDKLLKAKANLEDIQEIMSRMTLETFPFDDLENISTDRLEQALKQLEADEKRLASVDKDTAKQIAENKRKIAAQITKNKQAVQDYANAEKVAANTGKHTIAELQQAYDTLKVKLTTLTAGQKKEIAETRQQMKQLKVAIDDVSGSVSKQNSIWQTAVRNITAYVGVFGMFNAIKNGIQQVIRGGEELSDQMAKVRMVSGLAMQDIEELTRRLAKMDTRTTLQELSEISYIGSKLGFGEMGIEGLEAFTRAANQVNVALKEDLGDEALTALSKITENMGLIKKMGVEQAMLATSSAMFKLYTTSTAAAGPIVEVTRRLAPMAQISGFATHEILALASANDALMQSEEVAGTALSKFIMAMQTNHNIIEQTLGMAQGSIAKMMKSGQSMEALMTILDKMSGKNVTELSNIWKLLGSDGDRLKRVILAMANHTDMVRSHLETSTKAFKEATAVTEEYNIQQETAMAYLLRAENKWRNAFINPDSSLSVKEMTKAWYDFTKAIVDSDLAMGSIKVTVDFLLLSIRALIQLLPMIAFGLLAKGAALLVDKMKLAKIATDGFATSWKKMDAATKSNWIGLIVGSLVQAVFWIKEFTSSVGDAEKEQKKLNQAIESMHEKQDEEIGNLKRLKHQLDDTNLSQEERNALLTKVKTDYDIYLNYLGIEKKAVVDLTKHYDALSKVMKQRFAYEERENYKRDVMGGEDGSRMKRRTAGSELSKAGKDVGVKDVNLDLINSLVDKGKSASEIRDTLFPQTKDNTPVAAYVNPWATTMRNPTRNRKADVLWDKLVQYVDARKKEVEEETSINASFANEIGDFDYDKWLRTQVMGEFKIEEPGGGGGSDGKRAELKDAEQKARAIIDNIKNYYQRQMNAVNDMANDVDITDGDLQGRIDHLKESLNNSLSNARKAIGGEKNEWEKFKADMRDDLWEQTDEEGYNFSENILNKILDNNLDALRKLIEQLSKALGKDGNQLLDQILRKATESEGKNIKMATEQRKALLKEMLEKNYTGKVDLDAMNTMERFGIGGITNRQDAQLRTWAQSGKPEDTEAARKFFAERERQWYAAFAEARKHIADVINTDIEGKDGKQKLLTILFGTDYQQVLQGKELEGFLAMSDDQWRVFYQKLIDYNDQWTDAQRKAYEETKKRQDFLFNNRPDVLTIDSATQQLQQVEQQQNLFGQPQTFGRQMGFVDTISNDPELMRYDLLQARAELYYNKMYELRQQDLVSEAQLKDARDALTQAEIASQQKLMEAIQARTQTLQNSIQPITDFAENAGQKLGDMMFNMESQSMTWNQIWKSMLLAMGKSIIQMGQQYAIQKLQRSLFNKQIEADETLHQELLTAIAIGGALARTTGEITIMKGALVMKKVINGEEVVEEISLATILTALGISKGAAKTIGALGWLGIPLVAVIGALLTGLLTSALSTAGAESNASSASTSTTTPKTKLVSGMLTYDKGNVQRFIGQDGRVYTATEEPQPKDGLVTRPIATTVQGQPALVAERGPEIVIGRETTEAIMMNEPELIRYIANYDRHGGRYGLGALRAYDSGNVSQMADGGSQMADGSPAGNVLDSDTLAALRMLPTVMNALTEQLKKPVYINKYGTGGLIEEVKSGLKFDQRYNG